MMAGRCDAYGVGHCDYTVVVLVVYEEVKFIEDLEMYGNIIGCLYICMLISIPYINVSYVLEKRLNASGIVKEKSFMSEALDVLRKLILFGFRW